MPAGGPSPFLLKGGSGHRPTPSRGRGAGGLRWGVGAGPGRRRGRCEPASLLPQADSVHRAAVLRQGFESRGAVRILWSSESGSPRAVYLRSAAGVSVHRVEPCVPRLILWVFFDRVKVITLHYVVIIYSKRRRHNIESRKCSVRSSGFASYFCSL